MPATRPQGIDHWCGGSRHGFAAHTSTVGTERSQPVEAKVPDPRVTIRRRGTDGHRVRDFRPWLDGVALSMLIQPAHIPEEGPVNLSEFASYLNHFDATRDLRIASSQTIETRRSARQPVLVPAVELGPSQRLSQGWA